MPKLVGVGPLVRSVAICLALVAEPALALAHDSLLAHDLAWRAEGASADFGASTNRGIIFKSKAGARLLCHEAIQAHPSEHLPLVPVADGWLVATSGGVIHLDSAGCPDESAPRLGEGAVQGLLWAPDEPRRLYAVTADANVGSGLYVSEDEGQSFRALLQLEGQQFYNAVAVQPAPEPTLYLSGASYDAETSAIEHFIDVRSPDAGTVRHAIPLSASETQVRMLAADLQRVFARVAGTSDGSTSDRLLVSEDGGGSWDTLLVAAGIRQLSFGADGDSLWLASAEGLYFSESGEQFERQELTWNPSCVEPRGDELVLCDALGIYVATEPAKPETLMFFAEVTAPVSCDGSGQPLPACEGQWADFYTELPALPTSRPSIVEDAGTLAEIDAAAVRGDAGRESDGEPKTRAATLETSGCTLAQRSTPACSLAWSWGLWCVAVSCLVRLRRERRAA